jgi:5-methylcytosine-specific restriction protein A
MPTTCELCARVVPDDRIDDPQVLQEHHLRPERRADSPTVTLCRPCHEQIHATFTNEQLREEYDSIEALREADPLAAYLSWIRTTDKLDIQVETSDETR